MGGDMPIGTDSQHSALAPADKGDQPGTAWRKGVQDRWTEDGHKHKLSYQQNSYAQLASSDSAGGAHLYQVGAQLAPAGKGDQPGIEPGIPATASAEIGERATPDLQ